MKAKEERRQRRLEREKAKAEKIPQSNQPTTDIPAIDVTEELKNFIPTTLRELKTFTDIQKAMVEINARQGDLLDRNVVDIRLQELSNQMQMFIDIGRRTSNRICQKLERPGAEKEIEHIIDKEVQKVIQDFKNTCIKKVR